MRVYYTSNIIFLPSSVANKPFPSFISSKSFTHASSEAPSNFHFLCRSPSAFQSLLISLRASHHHHRASSSPCCAKCRSSMNSGSGSGDSLGSTSLPCHLPLQLQQVKALPCVCQRHPSFSLHLVDRCSCI